MRGARLSAIALATALGSGIACSLPVSEDTVRQGILGGTEDITHGAVVALRQFSSNDALCSGTVFSVDPARGHAAILTAAHCIAGRLPSVVVVGDDYCAASALRYVPIDARMHPMFSTSDLESPYDIAVVRIVGDVANLPSMVLAGPEEQRPAVGDTVTALGFGLASLDAGNTAAVRRAVDLVVSDVTAGEIRIDQADGRGICQGDSGGPLLVTSASGEQRVVGVHSRLEPSGPTSPPCLGTSVSTRVTGMRDFLADALATSEPQECTLCRARAQSEGGACLAARRDCETRSACATVADCMDHCNTAYCKKQCMQSAPGSEHAALESLEQCPCNACASVCPPTDTCTTPGQPAPPPDTYDAGAPADEPDTASPSPSEADEGCGCEAVGMSQCGGGAATHFVGFASLLGVLVARRSTRVPRA